MDSNIARMVFTPGKKFIPIKVVVDVTQRASGSSSMYRYIHLPFKAKILGGKVWCDGTLATVKDMTISHGYISAGSLANVKPYLEPMTATELAARGLTYTAATTGAIFKGTVATTLVPTVVKADTNYAASGNSAQTAAPTGTSERFRARLEADDIICIAVADSDSAAVWHLELDILPERDETVAAKLTEA